jgi:hypothetical protein
MQMALELIQTIGIIATLIFTTSITIVQLKRTRTSNQINIYNNITAMLNNLRNLRINDPNLEKVLFKSREDLPYRDIKRHVYAVEMANIFELMWLSRKAGLVGKSVWDDWFTLWKVVILKDDFMKKTLKNPDIYTFSLSGAYGVIKEVIDESDGNGNHEIPDPYIGFIQKILRLKK